MSLWILIAIVAYMLFALSAVADKFLLTKVERHPIAYAFFTGVNSVLTFVLIPFGLEMLSLADFIIAVAAGVAFMVALVFSYTAIQQTSVSRVLPIQGGLVPLFTLILAYMLLGERLSPVQYIAFIFLVVGAVIISFKKDQTGWHSLALKNATYASILFAVSFVLTKYIYDQSNLVSGLVWTRVGFVLTALGFLLIPKTRGYIMNLPKKIKAKNVILYYSSRVSGGIAGLLQNVAISLGSVTIVNALQGVQFTFLLMLTTFLSLSYPKILQERITRETIFLKLFAFGLITFGLVMLGVTV